jgi:hypothetical protein
MGKSVVQELVLSYSVEGVNKGVGMDQTKGFDTCIDQESWTNRLIRRLMKLRERKLSQA